MTFEQATQSILAKALSLTEGWRRIRRQQDGSDAEVFAHKDIPGILLRRWDGLASKQIIRLIDSDTGTHVAESKDLTQHFERIKQLVLDEERHDRRINFENRIIAIAERL